METYGRWRSVRAGRDPLRPRAVPDVEFDEQFECEVRLSISSSVRKICASLGVLLVLVRSFVGPLVLRVIGPKGL